MAVRVLILLIVAAALPVAALGQEETVVRDVGVFRDTLDVAAPQPFQLRPLVVPLSEQVWLDGVRLDTTAYRLDARNGRLWVEGVDLPPGAELVVAYRVLPFELRDVYRLRSISPPEAGDSAAATVVEEQAGAERAPFDPFGDARLQRSGSISRGILAGNNRDVTLESGLRMQLSGEVVDGVEVQAVLTDENTPIQPDGTTQRINEFDRVFVQIKARQGTAQLGDFDLLFQQSAFARFSRKLQGVTLFGDLPASRSPVFAGGSVAVAGATTRGIFRSQDIQPTDGIQGPYRLEGANGERFIIVIPGTDVVYVDGQRMTRGQANDYMIDYQTGEVTFTPRRLMTSDRRVIVEFQYTTNQFTRTLVGSEVEARFGARAEGLPRARLGASFLREADSQQFNEEFDLTSQDSLLIVGAGDGEATRTGAELVEYDPEALYAQYIRETVATPGGQVDTIFVVLQASPPDSVAVYRVRFSRVGQGRGRYVRVGSNVNGIIYEYRGAGAGEYEPIRLLPKPKQQRLFDLRGGIAPFKGLEVFGEWARSLNDQNRLSSLDAADDVGDALLAGFRLAPTSVGVGRLSAEFSRRYTGRYFTSFDRTRPVEFGRRWNLVSRQVDPTRGVVDGGDETVEEAFVQLDVTPRTSVRGEAGRIELGNAFSGVRWASTLVLDEPKAPRLRYQVEHIDSEDGLGLEDGAWLRQLGRIHQPLGGGRLTPSVEVEHERREQTVQGTDSLAGSSFSFLELRPGIDWQGERLEAGVQLERRTEEAWAEGALRDAATAWTLQTRFQYRPGSALNTEGNVGYRVRRADEYFRLNQGAQNTESVVLQWNGRYLAWQQALTLNWFYNAQTERKPRKQEIYVRTGPGLGQYLWQDDNGNGVVEVNEFVEDAIHGEYVRTFVPSDTLISVISVQARLRVGLDPARVWQRAEARLKRLLSNIRTHTTLEVLEESREQDLKQIYLLNFNRFLDSTNTLNGRIRIGQEVNLFRAQSRYGVDAAFNQVRGLNELTAGEERRLLRTWRVEGRYRLANRWSARLTGEWEKNRVTSQFFASRRYDIRGWSVEPEVSFQPSRALRFTGQVDYARKEDGVGGRRARVVRVPVDARYSVVRRLSAFTRVEVAYVELEGQATGEAQFELTDGRGPGTSYLWSVQGNYALNQYLNATFAYDGRSPSNAPTLHTVRLTFSAVF